MGKLTEQKLKEVYDEVTTGHREPVQTIIRFGGDKEDYQKLYNMIKGYGN